MQHSHPSLPSSEPVTIIESALVVHYLIDAFPQLSSHVLPAARDPKSAYDRYTINLLTDTWANKVGPTALKAQLMCGTEDEPAAADAVYEAIKTHIEPQLASALIPDKGPFVGGSQRMTLFEVSFEQTANMHSRPHTYLRPSLYDTMQR